MPMSSLGMSVLVTPGGYWSFPRRPVAISDNNFRRKK
jgi:hypothetical protein